MSHPTNEDGDMTDFGDYTTLAIRVEDGVAFVTIDNPPINLLDLALIGDLARFGQGVEQAEDVRVVVFDSADPEFFIAHADVGLIQQLPHDAPKADSLTGFHAIVDQFRTLPQATIACIEGRARGGGSEFALSLDMRFGALGRAILAQPEVALGILPGGSGTQRLPRLMGRSRALEVVLGCADFPADVAERYGYLNRALPPDELRPFVDSLARRIASFSAEAVRLAKQAVLEADRDVVPGLIEEAHLFSQTLATEEAQKRMGRFLEIGGQTRELELPWELDEVVAKLRD
jgi:enoyl-CoA hydratase/carnithine racemase